MILTRQTPLKPFIALLALAMIFLSPTPALAVSDDVQVTVTVPGTFCIDYVPRDPNEPDVVFLITCDDFQEGSVGMIDHGDIYWCANVAPWKITVHRSEWTVWSGSPDFGWYLQIKYGPPENDNWITVETTPTDWVTSEEVEEWGYPPIGTGVIPGIDWKIKELLIEWSPPGTYSCTVYFTIVAT